jgi:hypothetical protein
MGAVMWGLRGTSPLLALPLAAVVYLGGLVVLGAFQDEDIRTVLALVPVGRLRARTKPR